MFNNIRHLNYIVVVARSRSLQDAARELNVSESAISAAVRACEDKIGYSIFVRHPAKPLTLTTVGADFVRRAEEFLETAGAFYEASRGLGATLKGTVRIGSFSAITPFLLPPIMRHCRQQLPNLDLQIAEHDLAELIKRLREGEIDLAVTYDLYNDSGVVFQPLFAVRPHIGVGPQHRFADRGSVSLAEMAEEPLILLDLPVTKQHILKIFADHGVTPKIGYYPVSIATLASFVSHGFGYSIFFLRSRDRLEPTAVLPRLALTEKVPGHRAVLAYSRNVHLPAKTRAVIDACCVLFSDRALIDELVLPG